MKKQLKKVGKMEWVEIGRRSAGRANACNKQARRKEARPFEWKGFSLREMDLACLAFFQSRNMPIRTFSDH